jgi:hypothetical protein
MNQPESRELGRLLADAVPPLPEPPDRIDQVRARVRRARLRDVTTTTTAVVVVLVAVVLAGPGLLRGGTADQPAPAEPPPLTADRCPEPVRPELTSDAPRQPVPAGATEAMLCVVRFDTGEVYRYQVLRRGVDRLATTVNEATPIDAPEPVCIESDYIHQYSLVFRHPDGTVTTVINDGYCGISFLPDGTAWSGTALHEFGQLYQEQVGATTPDPDTIPAPECPDTIGTDRLELDSTTFGPAPEAIERPIRWPQRMLLRPGQPALPYPLVGAVWCRYLPEGDQARLVVVRPEPGDLADLRDILNDTFALTDTGAERRSGCGQEPDQRVAVPDVLRVVDATGGTAEHWVYGHPGNCWEVFRDPVPVAATTALVDHLLDVLGP